MHPTRACCILCGLQGSMVACFQGYPFPVSITMVHLIVKFVLALIVRKIASLFTGHPPLQLSWRGYVKNIAPIGREKCVQCVCVRMQIRDIVSTICVCVCACVCVCVHAVLPMAMSACA